MIVITLPKGAEPGNPADEKYQNVTRVYDDQLDGKPYITAEVWKRGIKNDIYCWGWEVLLTEWYNWRWKKTQSYLM